MQLLGLKPVIRNSTVEGIEVYISVNKIKAITRIFLLQDKNYNINASIGNTVIRDASQPSQHLNQKQDRVLEVCNISLPGPATNITNTNNNITNVSSYI